MIPPIEKSVIVPLTPEDAFRLFTENFETWWPGTSQGDVILEPGEGGRVTETRQYGREVEIARITQWVQGEVVSLDWYAAPQSTEVTQVQVTFIATETGTLVRLVHDGFDQLAQQGPQSAANQNGPAWSPGRNHLRRARARYSAKQPVSASARDRRSAG